MHCRILSTIQFESQSSGALIIAIFLSLNFKTVQSVVFDSKEYAAYISSAVSVIILKLWSFCNCKRASIKSSSSLELPKIILLIFSGIGGKTNSTLLISGYFYSKDGSFNFDLLEYIDQYPSASYFKKYDDKFLEPESTSKYWLQEQIKINKDNELRFFKTHNALCKINNNSFTNEKNTLGAIYIVRDPRNVLSSLAHHYQIDKQEAFQFMKDEKKSIIEKEQDRFLGFNALLSWSLHQKSWSECIRFPVLTIRYEDLETKTFETFKIVYDFYGIISTLS